MVKNSQNIVEGHSWNSDLGDFGVLFWVEIMGIEGCPPNATDKAICSFTLGIMLANTKDLIQGFCPWPEKDPNKDLIRPTFFILCLVGVAFGGGPLNSHNHFHDAVFKTLGWLRSVRDEILLRLDREYNKAV